MIRNVGNGIDRHLDVGAHSYVRELRLAVVGRDPHLAAVHNVEKRLSGLHELSLVDMLAARHAVARRHDNRI